MPLDPFRIASRPSSPPHRFELRLAAVARGAALALLAVLALGSDRASEALSQASSPAAVAEPERSLAAHLAATRAEGYLPLGFVDDLPELTVFWHDDARRALAYALPAPAAELPEPGAAEDEEGAAAISLYRGAYLEDGGWRPVVDLPADAAEYLWNVLVQLALERKIDAGTPAGRRMAQRADALLAALPADERRGAYVQAAADFASHALSVAGQLERSHRLHRAQGSSVCRHKDAPWSLFGGWEKIFGDGLYSVVVTSSDGSVPTSLALEAEDKELLRAALFGDFWTGDRDRDLVARYCE